MADTASDVIDFDAEALRAKYQAERDKRLRRDGNDQYVNMAGDFAAYLDDPYVAFEDRAALSDHTEVIVIGGGFGGLLMGARLREAGFEDIRIIEKGGDFGGTWYWNRYPGAACDIESYVYLPLLEETGFMPKWKYTPAYEILDYCKILAERFRLYDKVCFQTTVESMVWDADTKHWVVETNRGDRMTAQYVVMSNGPLHRPKLPGIKGVGSFKGHSFHTSRWDYDYTGGGPDGGLDRISDKRIGIIGTGATAVQCVPHLAEGAKELVVFQRTPSSIDVRNNRPTDPDWAASLEPGWHKKRMDNFNILVSGGFAAEDLVNDGWTEIIRNILFIASQGNNKSLSPAELLELAELADFKKMEAVRARTDEVVEDKATADALKPWYRQFCKRPCFHDEYLQAFNRDSVTLVDTEGRGVDEITERGVIANGELYELDCLIYATGFEVGTDYTRRSGYDLEGKDGLSLSKAWAEGMRSLHGMLVRGFPNVFVMGPAQAGFTANYPHLLDEQAIHIAHIAQEAKARGAASLEVSAEAEATWVQTIKDKALLRQKFLEECTPGYYNNEGKPGERAAQNNPYGGGPIEYFAILEAWRKQGGLPGVEIDPA